MPVAASLISAAAAVGGALINARNRPKQQAQVAGGTSVGGGSQMQVNPAQISGGNPAAFGRFL